MPRCSAEDRAEMVRLYVSGKSISGTATTTGCSPTTVLAALDAAGVRRRPSGSTRLKTRYGTWSRRKTTNGYLVWSAWDSQTRRNAILGEHRDHHDLVARSSAPRRTVHHKDGNRANNDPSNLERWTSTHPTGLSHCPHCHQPLWAPG